MKSVIEKSCTWVRPAEETPNKVLWLSRLDMVIRTPYAHNQILFLYDKAQQNSSNILMESLSKALVPFYPFAGRLRMNETNSRYEIDCNAQGALFVEAETTHNLEELKLDDEFRKLMVPKCDYSKDLTSFPLLLVQLTRFNCGGVCVGVAQHHHSTDGSSAGYFFNSWARLARGLDIDVMPEIHDRIRPRDPPEIKFQHLEHQPPLPPLPPRDSSGKVCDTIERVFKLSKEEIERLKVQASSDDTPRPYKLSTYEILAGHVWRCVCKARRLPDDQDVGLKVPLDGRLRLKDPPLPPGYCGNVMFFPPCILKSKEIVNNPVSYAASKLHEMLEKTKDSEYLRSSIDYLESQPNLEPLVGNEDHTTCPNLYVNSFTGIPFDEVDFGWGKPRLVRHGGVRWEGQVFMVRSSEGDGSLLVTTKLFRPHMALFDKYLYALGDPLKEAQLGI